MDPIEFSDTGSAFGVVGIVPVFVNIGAAILPAIVAGLSSALALLFKPRELLRLFRRKPWIPVVIVLVLGSIYPLWLGTTKLYAELASGPTDRERVAPIGWSEVAQDIIRYRESHGMVAFAPVQSRDDAYIFRRNVARTGYDGGPVPRKLREFWRYNEYPDEMVLSSPAVVGRRVYGASCQVDVGGNYGAIFCLDAESGKTLWSTSRVEGKPLKGFFSSPAVTADGRYLVIGQGLHFDTDCYLICLETETGKLHWRVKTPLHVESSPAIRGDLVVAGAGAVEGPDMKPRGHGGYVFGVRISDGKELWRYDVADPESSPVIDEEGVAYIGSGFNGKAVVALRTEPDEVLAAEGKDRLIWRTETPYPATGAVTLVEDMVVIGGGNGNYVYAAPDPAGIVMALDRRTGEVRWERHLDDAVLGAVAATDGMLICAVRDGHIVALRLEDGEPVWSNPPTVSGRAPVLAAPAAAGPLVYGVSRDGYLAVIRTADGKVLETHYINHEERVGEMGLTVCSPAVAGGRVFVGSETGGLRCYAGEVVE